MFKESIARRFYKWFPKPLSQDVIEVFDKFGQLAKLGLNDEDQQDIYHYLRIVDLCEAIKKELFSRGVMFTATDKGQEFQQISQPNGGFSIRCTVTTEFGAVRGKDRLALGSASGSAESFSDKSLAIAQTAAFKAFLKRSSMTYGKEDDPEIKREGLNPKQSVRIASYQRRALDAALRNSGINSEVLCATMTEKLGFAITCEQIADLPSAEFDEAMKLILRMGQEDLTASWSAAVVDISKKKGGNLGNSRTNASA